MASVVNNKIIHVTYSDEDELGAPDISEFVDDAGKLYVRCLMCMERNPPIYAYEVNEKYHQFFISNLENKGYHVTVISKIQKIS